MDGPMGLSGEQVVRKQSAIVSFLAQHGNRKKKRKEKLKGQIMERPTIDSRILLKVNPHEIL